MGKKNTLKNFWVRLESASSTVTGSLFYLKPNFPNGKKEPELVFDCGTFLDNENKKYKQILISQYHFCNKHIKEIKTKAFETYNKSLNNKFFKKVCCNSKLLEEKMKEYE